MGGGGNSGTLWTEKECFFKQKTPFTRVSCMCHFAVNLM